MPAEPRYQLSLTYDQLRILKNQMEAAAEPAHRCDIEAGLLEVIARVHQRAWATRKAKTECVHDYNEFTQGAFCVKCGEPE